MTLCSFETNEFEKLNLLMRGLKSEETDEEKMNRYFNLWAFENTQSKESYSDATSSFVEQKESEFN